MAKRVKLMLLLALVVALLCGCMQTVDEMYRLPKRSDTYNDLQSAIDSAMSGLTYCAPLAGENQQTVQMADLDGDGIQEYLLFAKSTAEKPLRILVFRNVDDTFVNTDVVECNGSAFDQIEYVDMDGQGGVEMVVGRQLSNQIIRSASVYSFADGELMQQVSVNYTKFLTTDFDGDNISELFLLRPGTTETDNGVAEVYCMKSGTMERYNEVSMSGSVDKLKRIITGKLNGGRTAVFVASAVDDSSLITDVFALEEGLLKNVSFSNDCGTAVQTMRNYYVYADDIDGDTEVELPHLITMKPLEDQTQVDSQQLICWYSMTPSGTEVNKLYTYHNFLGGWYMQLDDSWAKRLAVRSTGNVYEFFVWDESYKTTQKIMTVTVLNGQSREREGIADGAFILYKTESVVYSAVLEEQAEAYGLTQENAIYSFRLIQYDWKTGET